MARQALDNASGVDTFLHYDEHTDETHIEMYQDAQPVVDRVRAAQNENFSDSNEFQYMAEIPAVVQMQWLKMGFNIWQATGEELMTWIAKHRREYGYLIVDRRKPYAGIIVKGAR